MEHLPAELTVVSNRINRAQGHLDGGHRMLEEVRECEDECEDVAGVGLGEVERLIARLDIHGRLTRCALLRRRPMRRVGAHLGTAARTHQRAGRSC